MYIFVIPLESSCYVIFILMYMLYIQRIVGWDFSFCNFAKCIIYTKKLCFYMYLVSLQLSIFVLMYSIIIMCEYLQYTLDTALLLSFIRIRIRSSLLR